MVLSLDIDCILNNLVEVVVKHYNLISGDHLRVENITDYSVAKFIKPEYIDQLYLLWTDPLVWHEVEWYVDWVAAMIEHNFAEIYFVTATRPSNIGAKFQLLYKAIYREVEHMTEQEVKTYVESHLVVCQNKQLIRADVIIDDAFENLQLYRPDVWNILLIKPWNKELAFKYYIDKKRINNLLMCNSIDDIIKCLLLIKEKEKGDMS